MGRNDGRERREGEIGARDGRERWEGEMDRGDHTSRDRCWRGALSGVWPGAFSLKRGVQRLERGPHQFLSPACPVRACGIHSSKVIINEYAVSPS